MKKELGTYLGEPGHRLPYKMPTIYFGAKEQFLNYSYWCRTTHKYVRRKLRCELWHMTDAEKRKRLRESREEVEAILKERNRMGQYQDEFSGKPGGADANAVFEDWISDAIENEEKEERKKAFGKLLYNLRAFLAQYRTLEGLNAFQWAAGPAEDFGAWINKSTLSTKSKNDLLWAHGKMGAYIRQSLKKLVWPDLNSFRVKKIKNETGKYVPLSHEEKTLVFEYYEKEKPHYKLFLLLVYYTSIRPAELHRLQIKDFDLKGKKISVPWMAAKNGLSKHVQILAPLQQALEAYGLQGLPAEHHLFSDSGLPGPHPIKTPSWSTKLWWRNAEKLGLAGTKKTPYSLKHTFNIDYIENNKKDVDWEWLRRHNRHATIAQTQEYISDLTAYFLDEGKAQILDYVR